MCEKLFTATFADINHEELFLCARDVEQLKHIKAAINQKFMSDVIKKSFRMAF